MKITSIRQTTERVCDIVSVTTETLIIETPDPAPKVETVFTFCGEPLGPPLDGNRSKPAPRYGTSTVGADSKCGRGGGNSGDKFIVKDTMPVHFDCHQPGENVVAFREVHPDAAPVFDEHDFQAAKTRRFASPVEICRAAMEGKPQPEGEWPHGTNEDKFRNAVNFQTTPIYYELDGGRRPGRATRDIPLWAFQRDFLLQEFPSLGLHGAAKLADHFMDQWKRSFHRK